MPEVPKSFLDQMIEESQSEDAETGRDKIWMQKNAAMFQLNLDDENNIFRQRFDSMHSNSSVKSAESFYRIY